MATYIAIIKATYVTKVPAMSHLTNKNDIISTVIDSFMFSINNTRLFADRSNNNLVFFFVFKERQSEKDYSERKCFETHVYECHTKYHRI